MPYITRCRFYIDSRKNEQMVQRRRESFKEKKKNPFCLKSQKNLQISVSVRATDTNDNFSQGP